MGKTADNKRFGVSRGVCSQKVLREFESFAPVRAFAFPRPHAKPPTVKHNSQQFETIKTRNNSKTLSNSLFSFGFSTLLLIYNYVFTYTIFIRGNH